MLSTYLWCVVVASIFCFTLGFGMGANDVGNNFGTSIGSRSISLGNAIFIAGIFEFVGSVALGSTVTDAFRKGVYNIEAFGPTSDLLVPANLAALITSTGWLFFASATGLSVSTTHSLVGSTVGIGLAVHNNAVNWKYVGKVLIGWVVAPVLSLACGMVLFPLLRLILSRTGYEPNHVPKVAQKYDGEADSPYPQQETNGAKIGKIIFFPALLLLLLTACCFLVFNLPLKLKKECLYPDDNGTVSSHNPCAVSKWINYHKGIGFGVGIGIAVGLTAVLTPLGLHLAHRKVKRLHETGYYYRNPHGHTLKVKTVMHSTDHAIEEYGSREDLEALETRTAISESSIPIPRASQLPPKTWKERLPWKKDLHQEAYGRRMSAVKLANNSEKFDPSLESYFAVLQVVSSSLGCLVHGANDVANAVSPFANIYTIYDEGGLSSSAEVPIWLLVIGGIAITSGLTLFGYRVIRTVGVELIHISPCRGYTVEFAMTLILAIGSTMGLPLSTTQTSVGAMIGVGLMDRGKVHGEDGEEPQDPKLYLGFLNLGAVSWKTARRLMTGWVATILVNGIVAAGLYAYAVYSPTQLDSRYTPCWELGTC